MLRIARNRGAKHRFLILIYLLCFLLSLAPTIVAPPERGFSQGQPEMHQAMDNMVAHGIVIKKNGNLPLADAAKYPALLTSKTSTLLEEAEHVLSNLQNSKEKEWVEAFVHRMRAIAAVLEKTAQMNKQQPSKNPNSVSGTPVPEGLPLQPTWPAASAIPEINSFQKPGRMMSKFPVTSPELSQVLPAHEYPTEHLAVTKPAALSNNNEESEDDELVRELKSLHKEAAVPYQKMEELDMTPVFTAPVTPSSPEKAYEKPNEVETEKAKIKAKLIQEMTEFQRLGGALPNGLMNALNNQKTDLTHMPIQNSEESSKPEPGMVDKLTIEGLNDLNKEDKEISKTNMENLSVEKKKPFQEENQLQQIDNHTIPNAHINWHPNFPAFPNQMGNNFHYKPPQNKEQPYQKGLENAIQNLQKPNPFHHHGKYQTLNQQLGHIPDALKQQMSHPESKIYNSHSATSNYNAYLAKNGYARHPYMQYWDHKNSTLHMPSVMSPHLIKPSMNHQIDTQLSEEMKRELRDGKIIVLSDSVVRSNFEQNEESQTGDEKIKPPKNENLDNSKNGTQTPN